jgi:glycerol kinase
VISWQDRRTAKFVESLREHAPLVRQTTGLVLSPHYGASKIKWCIENLEKVAAAKSNLRLSAGPLASFLVFSLLSERPRFVDPANASRTLLWDVSTGTWSAQLAKLFGIPIEVLPACVPSRHSFGHLKFGPRDIPLLVCTGDQSAMPFAIGNMDSGAVYLNIGTGAFLQRIIREAAIYDDRLLRSVIWSDDHGQLQVQEGTVNAAGAALDWLNERVGIDTHRTALALTSENARGHVPVFVNGLSGVGSPFWLPKVESRFLSEGDEQALVQAVVESIAFLIATNIEAMRSTQPIGKVIASGGLSGSDYLCECVAALTHLPIDRLTIREATATGLAYLALGMPSSWQSESEAKRFEYREIPTLNSRYREWRQAMTQLSAR